VEQPLALQRGGEREPGERDARRFDRPARVDHGQRAVERVVHIQRRSVVRQRKPVRERADLHAALHAPRGERDDHDVVAAGVRREQRGAVVRERRRERERPGTVEDVEEELLVPEERAGPQVQRLDDRRQHAVEQRRGVRGVGARLRKIRARAVSRQDHLPGQAGTRDRLHRRRDEHRPGVEQGHASAQQMRGEQMKPVAGQSQARGKRLDRRAREDLERPRVELEDLPAPGVADKDGVPAGDHAEGPAAELRGPLDPSLRQVDQGDRPVALVGDVGAPSVRRDRGRLRRGARRQFVSDGEGVGADQGHGPVVGIYREQPAPVRRDRQRG